MLVVLGVKNDFSVFIIPHESETFSRWMGRGHANEGVVGIACALTLIDGGLKAQNLGLPAQCVLLDYPGCKHWRQSEISTEINLDRIQEILNL
ncbi:MAG: DUF116 domain-containing protein [Firmicutes bacterium]|nr:DUF116 domain-containing protein [Bacillota bacterium]